MWFLLSACIWIRPKRGLQAGPCITIVERQVDNLLGRTKVNKWQTSRKREKLKTLRECWKFRFPGGNCIDIDFYSLHYPLCTQYESSTYLLLIKIVHCLLGRSLVFSYIHLQGIYQRFSHWTCWLCAGQLAWPITWQEKQLKQIICLHKRQRTFELFRDLSRRVSFRYSVCCPVRQTDRQTVYQSASWATATLLPVSISGLGGLHFHCNLRVTLKAFCVLACLPLHQFHPDPHPHRPTYL